MTITFPLSTSAFADLISFDAGSRLWLPHDHQELSNLASGGTIAKDLRQRLWQADVQTVALNTDDYTTLESVLDSLDGATNAFYLYDPKRQYPKADPTGATLAALNVTNVLQYSDLLTNAVWGPYQTTIVSSNNSGPFGKSTAIKLGENTANDAHHIDQSVSGLTDNTTYSLSAWVKPAERSWVALLIGCKDGSFITGYFHLSGSGSVGTVSAGGTGTISQNGANGFYRCSLSASILSGATPPTVIIGIATADTTRIYTGTSGSGIYIAGAQLETGATSHNFAHTAGASAASQARIGTVTGTTAITIYGLPASYAINAGDRLHFDDSNSVRQYLEALETVTADTEGTTAAFTVAPYMLSGAASDQAVTFSKPCAKMCLKPGTRDNSTGIVFSTHKFQAVQVLA